LDRIDIFRIFASSNNKTENTMKNIEKYCPVCGHKFVQGESEYNNETANTDYVCTECGWEGTHDQVLDTDKIIEDLVDEIDNEGIEITTEDATNVIKEIRCGESYENAIKSIVNGILDCLGNEDDIDLSDKLQTYNGSYNKRTLKKDGLCIVTWPDSQSLCEMENFWEHAWLINDDYGLRRFGSCAYVVEEDWYTENDIIPNDLVDTIRRAIDRIGCNGLINVENDGIELCDGEDPEGNPEGEWHYVTEILPCGLKMDNGDFYEYSDLSESELEKVLDYVNGI